MNNALFIAHRVREVFLNGRWIANTNYSEQLRNTSYEQALAKIGNLNSVAALTYHINYYLNGLLHVFNGGKLEISDKYSFDLTPLSASEEWEKMIDTLLTNAELFAQKVEQMTDEFLNSPFVEEKYGSYTRNIEAVIEHSYYHLGQITLIRKLITQQQ